MSKAVEFEIKIKGDGGGVLRTLTIEASNADEAISDIVESASRAGQSIQKMAENALVLDTSIRAIDKLRDVVTALTVPFNSFETAMRSANTMAGKSGEEFDELTDQIVELSKTIPLAREELANGLYETISNGVPEDNWIGFLEQSARASVGGIADLGQTVTVTSTLIKNYGMEWSKAGEIQDKIQMTAKNGKTSFSELGDALPRVSGSAASLGISMDELMAVFATTTGVTGKTAEVSTQLAAVLNSLIKPTSEAETAAAAMGISFNAASVKACGGFDNFLQELSSSVEAYANETGQLPETIYGQLFGSAEALRLLTSLTGNMKDKFTENIAAMANSAGTISDAYDNMASTGDSLNVVLQNQIHAFMDSAGAVSSAIAPFAGLLAQFGMGLISCRELSNACKLLGSQIISFASASSRAAIAQKVVAAATKIWSVTQIAFNAIMSANPIAIVVLAIAALVAAIIAAYNNCESFRKICDKVWSVIKIVASAIWSHLVAAFEKVSTVVKKAWEWVKKFFGISDKNDAKEVADDLDKQAKSTEKVADANQKVANSGLKAKEAIDWQKMSYEQLGQAIERQEAKVKQLAGTNAKNADAEAQKLKQMQARYDKLGKQYNLSTSSSKNTEYDGKHLIANAKSYKELGNNISYYQTKLEKLDPTEVDEIKRLSELIVKLNKSQEAIKNLQASFSQPVTLDTLSDIDQALTYQQSLLNNAPREQMAAILKEIANLQALKDAMEDAGHVEVPVDEIKTYSELNDEITYYEGKLQRVNESERGEIAAHINALKELKQRWDDAMAAMKMPEDISKLDTITKLENAISYYQAKMKNANSSEIEGIQQTILALEEKEKAIKRGTTLAEVRVDTTRIEGLSGKKLKMELQLIGADGIKKKIRELQGMLDDKKNPVSKTERSEIEELIKKWRQYGNEVQLSSVKLNDAWGSVKGVGNGIEGITDALKGDGNAWKKMTSVVDSAIQVYDSFSKIASIVDAVLKVLGITKKADVAATKETTAATETDAAMAVAAAGEKEAASEVVVASKGVEMGAAQAASAITEVGAETDVEAATEQTTASTMVTAAKTAEMGTTMAAAEATQVGAGIDVAAAEEETVASGVVTSAKIGEAASKTMAAHASIPWVGIAIAGGMIAAMLGIMAALPKFADGGIAYGPTLGIFGEYAGAANNPEVVAPLNKLKQLIEPQGIGAGGVVRFRIEGRTLVGVLQKENRMRNRTR